MSKTIDERVVEMRFDNKQFESNVQTSLSTIEKLKKSLDMDGATKGLESIDSAAKKVDRCRGYAWLFLQSPFRNILRKA